MEGRVMCPSCWAWLEPADLAGHVRAEMAYAPWACALCHFRFTDIRHAWLHVDPEFERHPGEIPRILEELDDDKEKQLKDLLSKKPSFSAFDSSAALDKEKNKTKPATSIPAGTAFYDEETGLKRAACAQCPSVLSLKVNKEMDYRLKEHAIRCRRLPLPFACPHCDKRFIRAYPVRLHAEKAHPGTDAEAVRSDDREALSQALKDCFPHVQTRWGKKA